MNNVGVILSGNPEDIPLAEWQRIVNLNLFSAVRSLEVFLPKMIARRSGYIVNTASFAGLYPYAANRIPYVASKAAVIAMSESLALHLLPQGVRVSCLCPGPVMTRVMEGMKTWSAERRHARSGFAVQVDLCRGGGGDTGRWDVRWTNHHSDRREGVGGHPTPCSLARPVHS